MYGSLKCTIGLNVQCTLGLYLNRAINLEKKAPLKIEDSVDFFL